MTLPRTDTLKPRPRLGFPSRGVPVTKLVEGQTDAGLIRGITVDTTAPTAGQFIGYDGALSKYKPMTLAEASSPGSETFFSHSATELRRGNTNVVVGTGPAQGPSAAGDIVFSPGAIQRVEMLVTPRVGAFEPYSPTVSLTAAITAGQTSFGYNSSGDPIVAGDYLYIPPEAMLVQSVNTGTNTVTVARARLQTVATAQSLGASVYRVSVQNVMHVNGGLRATGGVATSDLALHGSSTQELLVRRTFTRPVATFAGNPDGDMVLHYGEHSDTANVNYRVEIDAGGATEFATFRWSADGGGSWVASGVATSQGFVHLQNGVTISFDYGTYQVGSRWDFVAIGTANQVELLRADTTTDTLHLRHVVITNTTAAYEQAFTGTFTYTGTLSPAGVSINVINQTTAASNEGTAGRFISQANSAANNITAYGLEVSVKSGPNQTGTMDAAIGALIWKAYSTTKPANSYGVQISNMSEAAGIVTSAALVIDSQTTGPTNLYNIWQAGTTGVNVLAAATRVGVDAPPAAGLTLEVTGDAAVSSQLHVGGSTITAGVALQLTGGTLRIAADQVIENAAGTDILKFPNASHLRILTPTRIGSDAAPEAANIGLQVSDTVVIGTTSLAPFSEGVGLVVGVPATASAGLVAFIVADALYQATASIYSYGYLFQGAIDLNGQTDNTWIGVASVLAMGNNSGTPATMVSYDAFQGQVSVSGSGAMSVTDAYEFHGLVPNLSGTAVTNLYGLRLEDLGSGSQASMAFLSAVDIAEQTLATDRYAFRVDGATTAAQTVRSVHRPNIAFGGGHALSVVPGATVDVDPTNLTAVTTEQVGFRVQSRTLALTSGTTIATLRHVQFLRPIPSGVAAGAPETITDASTVYIDDAPGGGTNITLTRTSALHVAAGRTLLGGELKHEGTTLSFFNVAAVTRPTAYTQTYSTADKTHAAFTSADIGAFTGGVVGFLDAAERDNIRTQFNALRADVADLKQLANSIIDDLQSIGLLS